MISVYTVSDCIGKYPGFIEIVPEEYLPEINSVLFQYTNKEYRFY
jgi:hypothetical protein